MDDTQVFGPVLFDYPFSEAIADGWLDDYRIAVVGVTQADIVAITPRAGLTTESRTAHPFDGGPDQHTAMVQAAIARAAADLGLRRVIAFCPRIDDARRFADTFRHTLTWLPKHGRPARPLSAAHIAGTMDQAERSAILHTLAHPPGDGWAVVSNARCLSEGIDVPAVDGIAFTAPKKSTIDIVQAVGRALRRDPSGSGLATILVPILLPSQDTTPNAQDTTPNPPPATTTEATIKSATSPWWDGYAALAQFRDDTGHTKVRDDFVTDDGFPLGCWVHKTREAFQQHRLAPDRIEALNKLDFAWTRIKAKWEWNLLAARRYYAVNGHLLPPEGYVDDEGVPLATWLDTQRKRRAHGRISAEQLAELDNVGMVWDFEQARWDNELAAAKSFHAAHGHIRVTAGHYGTDLRGAPFDLRYFLNRQRDYRRKGFLPAERIAALDALNIDWNPTQSSWEEKLSVLREFRERNGHLLVPIDYVADGMNIGRAVTRWRSAYRRGTLDPDRVDQLEQLGMVWDVNTTLWDQVITYLRGFQNEHGHLRVPAGTRIQVVGYNRASTEGLDVFEWLIRQRERRAAGKLTADEIADLDAVGMIWVLRGSAASIWDQCFQRAKQFAIQHGHLNVPAGRNEPDRETRKLYIWLRAQRAARHKGSLSADRIAALDNIGMPWDRESAHDKWWMAKFERVKHFHAAHGHFNLAAEQDPDIRALADWLRTQKGSHKAGRLRPERAKLLESIGFDLRTSRQQKAWNRAVKRLAEYRTLVGDPNQMPNRYKSPDGFGLHFWLKRAQSMAVAGELPAHRLQDLVDNGVALPTSPTSPTSRRAGTTAKQTR
jgi:hypothetical protein